MAGQGRTLGGTVNLTESQLAQRLDELIAAMGEGPVADEQRALLLDLQVHQIELEMQGRELRDAQRALEVSRDSYARLFDLAPVGYAVFDCRGRILNITLTAARLLGRPRSRLTGAPFASFLESGDMRPFLTHVERVLKPEGTADDDAQTAVLRLRADNGVRVLQLLSSARVVDSGRGCFSALVDITAQEEAQSRRRDSDHLRQTVLDALPAQVAVLDGQGRIIEVNRAWRRLAEGDGAPTELKSGLGLDSVSVCRHLAGDDAEHAHRIADGIAAVIAGTCRDFNQEFPCNAPDRERWFALTVVPLGGGMEGAVVVRDEISARKLAETQARRSRESAAQAARVNAVGILAASLIHELTQPLSAASFFSGTAASLLEQGGEDRDKLGKVLLGVDSQIKRAAEILHRLREFLRRRDMHLRRVAIDEVVVQATALVRWFAADKKVQVQFERPAPDLFVEADALQLEQVLVNLICNSIQAIDQAGTPRREVSISVDPRPGEVQVTVGDTGPGVPSDAHERMFDIFASTKDSGLGMGLAISRDIVEAHGGKLWAEAKVSEGALFHFTLPLKQAGNPE